MAQLGPFAPMLMPPLLLAVAYLMALLIPERFRPRRYLAPIAETLARKTHKPQRSPQQQRIAGTLASLIVLLPCLLATALILNVAAYPLPFELALLAWLMPGIALGQDSVRLAAELQAGHKEQARGLLSHWTIRDTQSLSELGLTKAGIETQLAHSQSQLFTVLFWYCIGGIYLTLLAWLCQELARAWHRNRPQMAPYAQPVSTLATVLAWPVNGLLALTLSLYGSPFAVWRARHQLTGDWQSRSQQWPQLSLAFSLGRQLGGPWQIEGQRLLRPRLGPASAPQSQDVLRTRRLLSFASWLWLALIFLLGAALALVWYHTIY
ncbi:cobalamin biosynthesis protein CobD/CbiB [Ferrimonas marina]|uniref:Adenosylcobinamide-phosphate synthase n=1 Tax=Ferrimonas marina TaxID=299255 RepID=A0A1M5X2M6_9GAMM|nr:cobalamin biosynthesis protein [Ferrimonas marina]SHH93754.1 adenosylcobinamide-phosphate synthase [Ferrimonas marina]